MTTDTTETDKAERDTDMATETDYIETAQEMCSKIVETASKLDEVKRYSMPLGLDLFLDGISYEAAASSEHIEEVMVPSLVVPCKKFTVTGGTAVFECMDQMDAAAVKCTSIGVIADTIEAAGIESIKKAVVQMHTRDKVDVAGVYDASSCKIIPQSMCNGKPSLVLTWLDLDKVIDLNYTSMIEKIAEQRFNEEMNFSESMKKLGKRFYEDEGGGAAAGGDAGGAAPAAPAAGDAGDTAAEMNGTSVSDVLGVCEPGKGYMGKDNFYIPVKAKCPLHRWEAANGGSKRKKKGKYPYEKGMKVVTSMFEAEDDEVQLNEKETASSYEALAGKTWDEVVANAQKRAKSPDDIKLPAYERWEAAQLPPPEEDVHGALGGCTIDEDQYKRQYLKEYYIHGIYKDGTFFELGPMKRKVASEYMSLHRLSVNSKAWDQMKADKFSGITEYGEIKNPLHIAKFKDGFWLVDGGNFKCGSFSNKQLARMYAVMNDYEMEKSTPSDKTDEGYKLEYPTFSFSYTMAGVPCMDIVVAEDLPRAMKLFDLQWRVFDNTRPIKDKFSTVQDLQRDLSLLRIKDIEIEELSPDDIEEHEAIADETGNPSTIPQLMTRCRNPKFKYFLGRENSKGGRLVVPSFNESVEKLFS